METTRRLGKYTKSAFVSTITFNHRYEAMSSILRKMYNSKKLNGVFVKPDLPSEERVTEYLLLRERKAVCHMEWRGSNEY